MRYVCAYMLAQMGGKENPTDADVKNILGSLMSQLKGKNMNQLIESGSLKLANIPIGGGGGPAGPAEAATAAAGAPAAKAEEKTPAKQEESEESDADMGMNLFD